MLRIEQFRYSLDNFAYLIHGERTALAIDGGAVDEIMDFLSDHSLNLRYVTNTHNHSDHTVGNDRLCRLTAATRLDSFAVSNREGLIRMEGNDIGVISTPGHTEDSVVFSLEGAIITGDTLFNGTVGNCYSLDLDAFFRSIQRILSFPESTWIYAGHDYVADSLAFARTIEPDNPAVSTYSPRNGGHPLRSSLLAEKQVNPFLRFNAEPVIEALLERNMRVDSELSRWKSMMSL